MIYYTSICSNYLPKAMALAASVKEHNPDAVFVLCLVEREVPAVAAQFPHFDAIVLAKDAGWENFETFMFRHSIVEASTAVKPRFMQYLMERYEEHEKFVYLDPDVLVYGEFVELKQLLDSHSIVLAPHLLRPGNIDMEISSLAHGSYNLGFLAVRRSDNSRAFVKWWAERLFLFCYDDKARGIFTDQKWIDLAPCFYEVHVLKHHGYDFATWSLLGSDLRLGSEGHVVNGDPLRFIHFSGLDSGTIDKAIGWWLTESNKDGFVTLYEDYKSRLEANGQTLLGKLPWTYATYESGKPVAGRTRVAFRDPELWQKYPAPFSLSDEEIAPVQVGSEPEPVEQTAMRNGLVDRFARSVVDIGFRKSVMKALRAMARS